jgi:hypothetical protein
MIPDYRAKLDAAMSDSLQIKHHRLDDGDVRRQI